MPKKPGRVGEADITCDVLRIVDGQKSGEISTTDLINALREVVRLSPEDQEILDNRQDDRFSQIVRNIKSHKKTPGNMLHDGLLVEVKGGFQITATGRSHLTNFCS